MSARDVPASVDDLIRPKQTPVEEVRDSIRQDREVAGQCRLRVLGNRDVDESVRLIKKAMKYEDRAHGKAVALAILTGDSSLIVQSREDTPLRDAFNTAEGLLAGVQARGMACEHEARCVSEDLYAAWIESDEPRTYVVKYGEDSTAEVFCRPSEIESVATSVAACPHRTQVSWFCEDGTGGEKTVDGVASAGGGE